MEKMNSTFENNNSFCNEGTICMTPVGRDSLYYNMNHNRQGFAYIFSHETFSIEEEKRKGADADVVKLKKCLVNLGFDVQPFRNLKVTEIKDRIEEARKMDHTNNNCFLLVVLSHGGQNKIAAYDGYYDPNEMFSSKFTANNCPTLAGKPKLFFLQCCQGEKLDPGFKFAEAQMCETETDSGNQNSSYKIPTHSDFCIMYAAAKGHYAFRNSCKGSFFMTALCEEITEHVYCEHLLTILTFVIRRVAVEFESRCKNPEYSGKKQIPYIESSLTRLVQFIDKGCEELEIGYL